VKKFTVIVSLGLAVAVACVSVAGAAKIKRPVVATWFSDLHPKAGQHVKIYVQFFTGKQRIAGARVSAAIYVGDQRRALRSATTNRLGIAQVTLTVPKAAEGKWLRAATTAVYRHHRYAGSNRVKVAG
jgi:hypothetical protein